MTLLGKSLSLKIALPMLAIFSLGLVGAPRSINKLEAGGCTSYTYTANGMPICNNNGGYGYNIQPQNNYYYPTTVSSYTTGNQIVAVRDDFFSPQNMNITAGTTVTWINQGTMAHTVTADNGMFNSGSINPGASFTVTFINPGSYGYHCQFHGAPGQGMYGTITVTGNTATNSGYYNSPPPPSSVPYNQYIQNPYGTTNGSSGGYYNSYPYTPSNSQPYNPSINSGVLFNQWVQMNGQAYPGCFSGSCNYNGYTTTGTYNPSMNSGVLFNQWINSQPTYGSPNNNYNNSTANGQPGVTYYNNSMGAMYGNSPYNSGQPY